MKVIRAKTAGFCFGVERAVKKALSLGGLSPVSVYTYGPLVHNEEVIRSLTSSGIRTVTNLEEFKTLPKGIVILRAHGVSEEEKNMLSNLGFTIEDATCPFVLKIHKIVQEETNENEAVIVIGDPNHPEVKGIISRIKGPYFVISDFPDIEKIPFPPEKPVKIVVQTTFSKEKFEKMVEIIDRILYNTTIVNTICRATRDRQEEARKLAHESDIMFVIGSKTSSNSQKLYDICKEECKDTYFLETIADLNPDWLIHKERVGITAGASTPENIIEEVQSHVGI